MKYFGNIGIAESLSRFYIIPNQEKKINFENMTETQQNNDP